MKTLQVRNYRVRVHEGYGMHASDLFALWLIQKFGKWSPLEKTITLGREGGKYDEHGKDILECEATLAARDLGIIRDATPEDMVSKEARGRIFHVRKNLKKHAFFVEMPALRDLFAAIVRDDLSGSHPFVLGDLVSTVWFSNFNDEKIREWAYAFFDAALARGSLEKNIREELHRPVIALLFGVIDKAIQKGRYHEQAPARLKEWLEKQFEEPHHQPFDLIECAGILCEIEGEEEAEKWLRVCIAAELGIQHHLFTETAREAKEKTLTRPVVIKVKEELETYRTEERIIAGIYSDDPYVHRWLLSAEHEYRAAVVVKRSIKNQTTQIFPGAYFRPEKQNRLTSLKHLMQAVAAFIREVECRKRGLSVPHWDDLLKEYSCEGDVWFFHRSAGWLMNGSFTDPNVRVKSKLSVNELLQVIERAVSNSWTGWRSRHIAELKK